jgi:predicted permease
MKIEALPGIEGASFSFVSPLGGNWAEKITVPGYQPRTVRDDGVFRQIESPGYFSALGIPVLLGRDFELRDVATAPKWAIVNEAAVRMYFGTENPIGRRIGLGPGAQPDIEIVGVVGDTKFNGLRQPVPRLVYTPALQQDVFVPTGVTFEVRTAGDPLGLVNGIQHEVQALDKTLPIYNIRSLSTEISDSLIRERLTTRLSILFSALALLLACVGLYGLLAYRVVEKNHEIGLRMALGAKKGDVLKMVMGRGLRLVTIGIGIGIAAALALTRFLSTLLYGVKPTDELTFIEVSLLLTCVVLLASYIPARRATKVDPMVALRYE